MCTCYCSSIDLAKWEKYSSLQSLCQQTEVSFSSVALRFVDSNKIGMEQASKQAGVSMIMVEGVVYPAHQQLLCGVHRRLYHDHSHTCLFASLFHADLDAIYKAQGHT